jgi:hypothetical protein
MPRSTSLDDLLPYLMNRLVARLNQNLGERLRRHGYSFQEWRVLAVLAGHDGITLSQLADAAVIPQPTVSRLVARWRVGSFFGAARERAIRASSRPGSRGAAWPPTARCCRWRSRNIAAPSPDLAASKRNGCAARRCG